MTHEPLSDAERAFLALRSDPKAFAAWARQARVQWEHDRGVEWLHLRDGQPPVFGGRHDRRSIRNAPRRSVSARNAARATSPSAPPAGDHFSVQGRVDRAVLSHPMATPKNGSVTLESLRDSTAALAAWRGQVVSRATTSQADLALARLRRRRGEHERRVPAAQPSHKR